MDIKLKYSSHGNQLWLLSKSQVTDQVGSDTQVFSDGVLVLSRKGRGLTDLRPLAVNLPH